MRRPLTTRQARTCETATGKRCRCRCGGKFHGIARGDTDKFFEQLPEEDPHAVPATKADRRKKTREMNGQVAFKW